MVMQSMMRQYHRDFVHRVRSDRFSPCVTAVPHHRRTSDHVQAFDHEGTLMGSQWVLHPSPYQIPPFACSCQCKSCSHCRLGNSSLESVQLILCLRHKLIQPEHFEPAAKAHMNTRSLVRLSQVLCLEGAFDTTSSTGSSYTAEKSSEAVKVSFNAYLSHGVLQPSSTVSSTIPGHALGPWQQS